MIRPFRGRDRPGRVEVRRGRPTEIKIGYLRQGGAEDRDLAPRHSAPPTTAWPAPSSRSTTTTPPASSSTSASRSRMTELKDEDDAAAASSAAGRARRLARASPICRPTRCSRRPMRGAPAVSCSSMSARIDDRLREQDCRANVIHTAPTRSMLADGLAQYLVWKQWRKWLLVVGSHDDDKLFADALRRAAKRFGATHRPGESVRGHRRRAPHRQRRHPDPEPNSAVHAVGARARRAGGGRREPGVCRLPALPDVGCRGRSPARPA